MKKTIFVILSICMLFPVMALAEAFSLTELQNRYDGMRWQADYGTVRNETVRVDVKVDLPSADSIDVWDAEYRKAAKSYFCDNPEESISASDGFFTCTWPNEGTWKQIMQRGNTANAQSGNAEPAPLVLQYGQFDLNTAYSVNNDMTVQAAWELMQAGANRLFAGEDIVVAPHLVHAHINPGEYRYNSNSGDYELVKAAPGFNGVLFVMFDQLIDGIPVLALDSGKSGYSGWAILQSLSDYGLDSYSYHMAYQLITPLSQSVQNVHVCSPETIIRSAENLIQEGKLRSVYCLRLGYAVRSKGKGNLQLIPAWVIEGELFKDANTGYKNRHTILSVDSLEETQIIFDARTGEMIETRHMQYQ